MRRFARSWLALLVTALLAAGLLSACRDEAPTQSGRWHPAACWFHSDTELRITCGYVTVPLHHDQPRGRSIQLAVEVIHTPNPHPKPDPVMVLVGGPGGTLVGTGRSMLTGYAPTHLLSGPHADRDLVVLDQRGVGRSRPSLDCDPIVDLDSGLACRDKLTARGIDLTAFTTEEDAADVVDLGPALGYRTVNLFGYSYGSLLALMAMRAHPDGVRIVILASPLPPQVSYRTDMPDNTARALQALFADCAAHPRCAAAYPQPARDLRTAVDLLDAHPRELVVHVDGADHRVRFDSHLLIRLLTGAVTIGTLAVLPRAIHHAATGGDLADWAQIYTEGIAATGGLGLTWGMSQSVSCADEAPFVDRQRAQAIDAAHPEQRHLFTPPAWWFDLCARWPHGPVSQAAHTPVRSDVPTLIVTGRYDSANPPAYGRLIDSTLTHGHFVEFPQQGHIPEDACVRSVESRFLQQPLQEPDTSCTGRVPPIPWKTG
ncbi:hypothetical protein GCM10027517_21040 [Phycicoccus ginsengisoli]